MTSAFQRKHKNFFPYLDWCQN